MESYDNMYNYYQANFTLSQLGTGKIEDKLGLIGMICYITDKIRHKHPETTCYQVITKIAGYADNKVLEHQFEGLAVICEDFMRNTSSFTDFGMTVKDMRDRIKDLLQNWLPF